MICWGNRNLLLNVLCFVRIRKGLFQQRRDNYPQSVKQTLIIITGIFFFLNGREDGNNVLYVLGSHVRWLDWWNLHSIGRDQNPKDYAYKNVISILMFKWCTPEILGLWAQNTWSVSVNFLYEAIWGIFYELWVKKKFYYALDLQKKQLKEHNTLFH